MLSLITYTVFCFLLIPGILAQCRPGYLFYSPINMCYKIYSLSENYFTAWQICGLDGSSLISIPNAFVNNFIGGFLSPNSFYFTGLNKLTNSEKWSWLDGTPMNYSNWNINQGANYPCGAIEGTSGKWR